jgi:chromosomal replication initiation ATPase DnaA
MKLKQVMLNPYVFAGLPDQEAAKVRSNYFLKKIKKAKQIYANSNGNKKPFYEVKLDRLVIALEEFTHVTKDELLSMDKPRELADIRNVTIAVAVRLRLGSLKAIATYFKRGDHSTMHAAAKKGQTLIKQDNDLNDLYKKLLYAVS